MKALVIIRRCLLWSAKSFTSDFQLRQAFAVLAWTANTKAATDLSSHAGPAALTSSNNVDRSRNIIFFDIRIRIWMCIVWHDKVINTLQKLAGHAIKTVDVFRLGRYTPNKKRPILVKLLSAWDCRKWIIQIERLRRTWRKTMLERLKRQAVLEGKYVAETDGQLMINDVAVFSSGQGFFNLFKNQSNSDGQWSKVYYLFI